MLSKSVILLGAIAAAEAFSPSALPSVQRSGRQCSVSGLEMASKSKKQWNQKFGYPIDAYQLPSESGGAKTVAAADKGEGWLYRAPGKKTDAFTEGNVFHLRLEEIQGQSKIDVRRYHSKKSAEGN
mmetsp:Transcript_47703/g.74443  ORF Transcript_47703/g.74443 Transcript_47703/m.74443 type:complete len:126 (+) Transcript_47703:1-378(+)|eukprot:CAMPEP_0184290582 /NCGR_PEP_ID=MMETSP1049-20130417/2766_1 /TAXON_ID=77928 /ORGANISM="Proteomonas sulcata, Strain CCMP704" /LENGTH=125 /DNA_ID=CAMNT_0026597753 /DNA_START=1 /DNA_END=378 /DNA_ORIENTATION=+